MSDYKEVIFGIELDALFDTRLATLARMGIDVVYEAVAGGYYQRDIDIFNGVDMVKFNELYRKRDVYTLREAMITPMTEFINMFIKQTFQAVVSSPFERKPVIEINIHPYVLTDQQISEIVVGMAAVTGGEVDIRVINMNYTDWSVEYINRNYAQFAIYAYWEWIDAQAIAKNFEKNQIPAIKLYGPCLFKDVAAKEQHSATNAFSVVEKFISPFVKLELLTAAYFSVSMKRFKERQQLVDQTR